MPTYVAFLRAINLGARRKFGKDEIRAAVESTGATGVQTHINTGNVLLSTRLRSPERVSQVLEAAFLADRGFEVPTIVLRPPELVEVADVADRLWEEYGEPVSHYVTLLKAPPPPEAIAPLHELSAPGEQVVVEGRAAHLLIQKGFHESRLADSSALRRLGVGTARNVNVIRTLVRKWC